ncbi:MAG: 16S rRNA (cytosine(967)-C(5))-methyltransferase RsmB [Clostridia bacterium]|nr:16S rRNA (cytosine(967)-C(5))-methyltransferase RsmB [Clostridia bacterium]
MTNTPSSRALALETLAGVSRGKYGNIAVDTVLRRSSLSEADRHLFTALVYGVIERQVTLDFLIDQFSDRPTDALDEQLRLSLRMGLYQLIYMDRIPDHAAVGETVALLPKRTRGYANAILRAYLRFENALPEGSPRENKLKTPEAWAHRFPVLKEKASADKGFIPETVAYGIPLAMLNAYIDALGYTEACAALDALSHKPPLTLRVNSLHITVKDLSARLTERGLPASTGLYLSTALRLPASGDVTHLPGFESGDFFVQDEASQLCVSVLDAQPEDIVIDTCACPGSKSFGMGIGMKNRGEIHAFDLHESKLSLIKTGADRLGLSVISVARRDARDPDPALMGKADRVLCDVPCSGLGVMAKKPELRHKDLSESARLPAIQADILEASAKYVKDGGVLVYSTCTILPTENQQVVSAFLKNHPEFTAEDFMIPAQDPAVASVESHDGMVTLLPHRHGTDGFFIAKLRKTKRNQR